MEKLERTLCHQTEKDGACADREMLSGEEGGWRGGSWPQGKLAQLCSLSGFPSMELSDSSFDLDLYKNLAEKKAEQSKAEYVSYKEIRLWLTSGPLPVLTHLCNPRTVPSPSVFHSSQL